MTIDNRVRVLPVDEWEEALNLLPGATLFHSNSWLDILQRTYGITVERLELQDGEGNRGLIPIATTRRFGLTIAGSPLSSVETPFQGLLPVGSTQSTSLLGVLDWFVKTRGWCHFVLTNPPRLELVGGDAYPGWTENTLRTIYLDLSKGLDHIFYAMDPDCRNQIRQAERRGAEIFVPDTVCAKCIDAYYNISIELYRRKNRSAARPKNLLLKAMNVLQPKGQLRMVLAKFEGRVIAGGLFGVYKDTLYYYDGASLPAYNHLRPNNLVQWTIIQWAVEHGLRSYDMVGANIPSIALFKKGFGGEYMNYTSARYVTRWGGMVEKVYRLVAPLAQRILS